MTFRRFLTLAALCGLTVAACATRATEESAVRRGDQAFALGDYEEALAEYRLAVRQGADDPRTVDLARHYRAGGMGYGEAKQALFELIMDHFSEARSRRTELMNDPGYVEKVLRDGAAAANRIIREVTARARKAVGL